ncbi:DNA methyltransferase [Enterococcus sp.]|uniref:DNA methyltransferase n=1 Tax=Enterococcus sp. TaxID=35783 RepID=UPI00290BF7D4|nr:DNA methyltransferase [Enterococcus sp.]MDU5333904.1 DNA methyltransferase [Enterococcus sp.]
MDSKKRDGLINKALKFVKEHKDYTDEKQQAQMWLRDLFVDVFGINKSKVNVGFEHRVKGGYIDHLFNGLLLTEMKSAGKDLEVAKRQAFDYVMELSDNDIPKYVMVSDFNYIVLYNLDKNTHFKFLTKELPKYIELFDFFFGEEVVAREPQSPVNAEAAKELEKFHDTLRELNYPKNSRSLLMTRIVFCMFADDTEIFEKDQFRNYILNETNEDGSDLLYKLLDLFLALDTPKNLRIKNTAIQDFRFINGGLFKVKLEGVPLNKVARDMLIRITKLDWGMISPIIFGSMFEGAMDNESRHDLGAHFTSETNIMKVISSLFLDELRTEFDEILNYKVDRLRRLNQFHDKLSSLKFLDPACGSGNFLILAYREIRRLEHDVIQAELREEYIRDNNIGVKDFNRKLDISYQDTFFSIEDRIKVEVAQFYGIEIQAYAASIAKLGLWLMDHLMNMEASNKFGQQVLRLPLHAGAKISVADALLTNWNNIIDCSQLDYILGNPPFIGAKVMGPENKQILYKVAPELEGIKNLDFVSGWFIKSAFVMNQNPNVKTAFVATNSISQGIQAASLWKKINHMGINISFAHQTFKWDNNGASVFVVIIGMETQNKRNKELFIYDDISKSPIKTIVPKINEYLINASFLLLNTKLRNPISDFPNMTLGSLLLDNQNFILLPDEYHRWLERYPELKNYIHPYYGSKEILNTTAPSRYAIYAKDIPFNLIVNNKELSDRLTAISDFRKTVSKEDITLAETPTLYKRDRYWKQNVLGVPRTSSSARKYIPMAYFDENTIISDAAYQVTNAPLELFGVLETRLHTVWARLVTGKLKGDFRYSNTLCYNTFPIPKLTLAQIEGIEHLAQKIIEIRNSYMAEGNTLANLYGKIMPPDLRKAHTKLDKIVEIAYSGREFLNDNDRLSFLISMVGK